MKRAVEGKNIVVIGSGIGGLSAGIILSQLNYDVTLVEKNSVPGGLMRSYRRSGIDCPVGVHYVGALGANEPLGKMFDLLGISVEDLFERMGPDGIIDRYIFDDFTFDLPVGFAAYEKNLLDLFPQDRAAISLIMKNVRDISRRMLTPSFLLNSGNPFQNIDYLNSMGDLLGKLDISNGLREVLAVPVQLIGVPLTECPVVFHHMVLAGYLFSSWRLKEGGSHMADVFARRFAELGGQLILGDGAEEILLTSGKVAGLRLQSGETLPAAAVVAAIHPKVLLDLLETDVLKSSYRQRVLGLRETEGVVAVQVSVDAPAYQSLNHNIYRLPTKDQGRSPSGFFCQLRRGNAEGANLLSIISGSSYSEWSRWENSQSGRRGAEYHDKKMNVARNLLREAGAVVGNIRNPVVLDVFTPLTLRDFVNSPEGSCYGVMRSQAQLLKIASLNNIPVAGLYLAGQNAVAPGVLGCILGSFNAARLVAGTKRFMQELKLDTL
jgi:all-trans-retinol 13,14-reductase